MQNALSPNEYDVVRSVFDALAQAEWFDRTDANESACARLVLLIHSRGIVDPDALREACEPHAKNRYAKISPS
ncbi:MAG: hypothetical protein KL863_12055 [Rhizobium sp.]|nr:hypothetical protein [Rhizobium sp.]